MTQLSTEMNTESARVREYRSRVAQALITLLRQGDAMDGVNWSQLDSMPAWILYSDSALTKLTHRIAVTALCAELAKSIDGLLLNRISQLVGVDFLKRALSRYGEQSSELNAVHETFGIDAWDVDTTDMLDTVGTSILLSSIGSESLKRVVARRFSAESVTVSRNVAIECIKFTEVFLQAEKQLGTEMVNKVAVA